MIKYIIGLGYRLECGLIYYHNGLWGGQAGTYNRMSYMGYDPILKSIIIIHFYGENTPTILLTLSDKKVVITSI